MIDPSLPLQKAVVGALKAETSVTALVSNRVYDQVPEDPTFPYVALGYEQTLQDFDQCNDGAECFVTLDCWSRDVGRVEAKQIAAAVVTTLDSALTLPGFAVVIHEVDQVRHMRDPDGFTSHSVVTIRYGIQPA
jgi:hypothetical protein